MAVKAVGQYQFTVIHEILIYIEAHKMNCSSIC